MSFEVLDQSFTRASELPIGSDVYYLCRVCDKYIPSKPKDNIRCECGNIVIDKDYHRLYVREFSQVSVAKKI